MFEGFLMFLALCSVGWMVHRNNGPMPIRHLPPANRRTGCRPTSMENRS
jgi:hypothetical protein